MVSSVMNASELKNALATWDSFIQAKMRAATGGSIIQALDAMANLGFPQTAWG
jgi:hypothetical protein